MSATRIPPAWKPSIFAGTAATISTTDDVEESDDEWWNEEGPGQSTPPKVTTSSRVTQWPRPPDGAANGVVPKLATRKSTRRQYKRYSVQKPTRDKSRGRQKKQNAKAGIKVVTTFSRHHGSSLRPAPVQLQPAIPTTGQFVNLAALQALAGEPTQTSGASWKWGRDVKAETSNATQSITKNLSKAAGAGLNGSGDPLERKKTKRHLPSPLNIDNDLSPSDRPIVIGISIPSARLADHTMSPQTASTYSPNMSRNHDSQTPASQTPNTPNIIITPAEELSGWSPLDGFAVSSNRRPTSSVYSQMPYGEADLTSCQYPPPVPQMPASVLENERQRIATLKSCFSPDSDDGTIFDRDEDDMQHSNSTSSRVVSSYTTFEEDESPIISQRARAVSVSMSPKAARRASTSTVGTSRHSKGWWNYVFTPFITRSNTVAVRDADNQQPPELPSLAAAAAKVRDAERDRRLVEKQLSPLTPQTTTTINSDSWWNSLSKDDPFGQRKAGEESPMLDQSGTLPFVLSDIDIPDGGAMSRMSSTKKTLQRGEDKNTSGETQSMRTSAFSWIGRDASDSLEVLDKRRLERPHRPAHQDELNNSQNSPNSATGQALQPVESNNAQTPVKSRLSPSAIPPPPPYSPPQKVIPKYRAVFPPGHALSIPYPASPGPLTPGMNLAMPSRGAIPLSDVPLAPARRPINLNSGYPNLPSRQVPVQLTAEHLRQPSSKAKKAEAQRRRHEKEDAMARRFGGWWRGRGCIPDRGCYGRRGAEGRKRRRWYFGLAIALLSMIILVIVLATTLGHGKSNKMSEQSLSSRWLNLTGFPPLYMGISRVAAPVNVQANSGCVFPATMWSCELPKELQESVAPNQPIQPAFLLQIQWDNSSSANATFANVTGDSNLESRDVAGNPVSAGQLVKNFLLKARQAISFEPSPAPPSFAEEFFLGNTTDGIVSSSKAGEPTPFYLTFLSTTSLPATTPKRLRLRATNDSVDQFPNITEFIPAPSLNADGTAAPANLVPLPVQQPIRLYDRGLPSEHYGFYTYFDRSIFLKSITLLNDTNSENGEVPDDENGGATEAQASFRCTWSQTRFLVQIWTRMNSTTQVLNGTVSSTSSAAAAFKDAGTFPYPITITTDRHGGDPSLKMVYCYGMDDREGIVRKNSVLNSENRAFGGVAINKAPDAFTNTSDPSLGGFDGGTGGCGCQWVNFEKVIGL